MKYDLIVVGGGIAAWGLLYQLVQSQAPRNLKILLLSCDYLNPGCSMRSTGVVAAHGITLGHSRLGDILAQAYQYTQQHFVMDRPAGVESAERFYMGDEQKLNVRFGELKELKLPFGNKERGVSEVCFLIRPRNYLSWLSNSVQTYFGAFQKRVGVVTAISSEGTVETLEGDQFFTDRIFLAVGAYGKQWQSYPLNDVDNKKCKEVVGHYLEWKNVTWGRKSFVYTQAGINLIYRGSDETLLLGGSTQKEGLWCDDTEIYQYYAQAKKLWSQLEIPAAEQAICLTGLRQKGAKRLPSWGKKSDAPIWYLQGLYKNGWTVAHLAGRELAGQMSFS